MERKAKTARSSHRAENICFTQAADIKTEKLPPFMTYDDILLSWAEPQNGLGDIYWIDARIIEDLR